MDESGLPAHDVHKHNHLLVDTYVEENEGDECISVAEHIAEEGHMFRILDGGLNWDVFEAMVHETGMFSFFPASG
jgi:hypothetical protein